MASPFDPSRSKANPPNPVSPDAPAESEDLEELLTRPFVPPVGVEPPPVIQGPAPAPEPAPTPPLQPIPARARFPHRSRLEVGLARSKRAVEQGFRQGARWVDAQRTRLPIGMRRKIEHVPSEALFGLSIAIPCFMLGVGAVLFALAQPVEPQTSYAQRATASSTPGPAKGWGSAPRDESRAALAHGEEFAGTSAEAAEPEDEGILLLNLAESLSAEGRAKQALAVLDRLLARRPSTGSEPRIFAIFANTIGTEEQASFTLLENMGEAGAAIVYRLATSESTKSGPKQRAETWLKSRAFERAASLPLYTLVKLRIAKGCEEKRALLGLASAGGRETLDYLRELESHTSCAPKQKKDCYACLRDDPRLSEAIARLERRLGN